MAGSSIGLLLLGWRDQAYADEHGVSDHMPAAQQARQDGLARIDQPGGRRSLAIPVPVDADQPHLALAYSAPAEIVDGHDLLWVCSNSQLSFKHRCHNFTI